MIELNGQTLSPGSESRNTCDTDDSDQLEIKSLSKSSLNGLIRDKNQYLIPLERKSFPNCNKSQKKDNLNLLKFQEIAIDNISKQFTNEKVKKMFIEIEEDYNHH